METAVGMHQAIGMYHFTNTLHDKESYLSKWFQWTSEKDVKSLNKSLTTTTIFEELIHWQEQL